MMEVGRYRGIDKESNPRTVPFSALIERMSFAVRGEGGTLPYLKVPITCCVQ
jgi:hypothetical protein